MKIRQNTFSNILKKTMNPQTCKKRNYAIKQANISSLNCLANYNKTNINFGLRLNTDVFDLSKIKLKPNFKEKAHSLFMYSYPMGHPNATTSGIWRTYNSMDETHCPWKMHIYTDKEIDLQKICVLLAPYFKKNDITWKTLGPLYDVESTLNQTFQKGKGITIYPHSNDEFARLAHDINFIIKNNNLEIGDSKIIGDRQLGDSGRIFYRYEYKSGKDKNLSLNLGNKEEYKKYDNLYEPTRLNDRYLANDMTPNDDIWFNFNPDTDGAKTSE